MRTITLGEVATYINGKAFKPSEWSSSGKPIIRIQNLTDPNKEYNYFEGNCDKRYHVKKGDVLISWSASLGLFEWTAGDAYLNQHIFKVKFDKVEIDKNYFKYMVSEVLTKVGNHIHGSTMKHITKKRFDSLQIPFPPLEIQKKIAEVLDKADAIRQRNRLILQKYDQLAQSVFLDMFGDPVTNPKGWEKSVLGNYINLLTDYHANGSYKILKSKVEIKTMPDYALMVRTTDLENNNFESNCIYISEDAFKFLKKSKLEGGEIIINKIGSAGKVYLMPSIQRPATLGMNAFMLRFKQNVDNLYIYFFLTSSYGEAQIQSRVKGAVTKTIKKDAVRSLPILVPPLELQARFSDIIRKINSNKEHLQIEFQRNEELFQSLLQRAFKGELFAEQREKEGQFSLF